MTGRPLLHYRILSLLGRGGMSNVYLALDEKLDREVALKILPPREDGADERLRQEARALAALNHPNIVTIYAVEEAEGQPFLVMERIRGASLETRLKSGGLAAGAFFAIALPLTEAVAAAHERGILHRDLKPANVMMTTEGRLKVLDFGLAERKAAAGKSRPTDSDVAIAGTLHYLAPEVIENKELDARADVFSLGVLLHELATGSRPFRGDRVTTLMLAILRNRRTPARFEASLPPALPALIDRCLAAEPAKRFDDARQLYEALCLLQGPALARAEARRRWFAFGGLLAAGLALVLFLSGGLRPARSINGGLEPAPPAPTANLEAYNAYLRGRDQAWLITNLDQANAATLYLERAVELDPKFVLAWCELANTHAQVFHFGLDRSSQRAEMASQALEKARALAPQAPEVHRAYGFLLYWTRHDYEGGLAEFDQAIALAPNDARSREGRAFIQRRKGNMEEAMAEMRRVVELSPRDGRAWRELGVTATYLRRYDEAVAAFEESIQVSLDPTMAYLSEARVYWMSGNFAAARKKLSSRPPIEQDLPHFHAFWQEVYEGQLDAALAELDQVKNPLFSWSTVYTPVASLRAMVFSWQGRPEEAHQQFQSGLDEIDQLLARQLGDARLYALRAQALIQLGRREEAQPDLATAQKMAREGGDYMVASEVLFEVAVAWVALGENDQTIAALEKLLREPSNLVSPPLLERDPRFKALHTDARFVRLIGS